MRCPSCNGHGYVRGFHACTRCRGTGFLYPRFFGKGETPAGVAKELLWSVVAIAIACAAGFAFLFL